MADDIKNPDASLEMEPVLPPPRAGDMEEKKKTQKAIRKAAATTVFFSAAVLVGYFSGGLHKEISAIYPIATFAVFSFGMALTMLG